MTGVAPGLVSLRAGDTTLALAPAIGGAVAAFRWRDIDLFRPAAPTALAVGDVLGMASFPLVPFAGRISLGRFVFDGLAVRLPVNLSGETDAIHGQGWQAPWTLTEQADTAATLRYDHAAGDWPWAYRAEQTFALADGALAHTLSVTNRSERAMPAGLGLHPYFPRRPGLRLAARVDGVFLSPDRAPTPPPEAWNWTAGAALDSFVDHQFTGWDGRAAVTWPGLDLTLALDCQPPARRLVVFAPTGEDYVCVEPVSHQLDAVNRSQGGADHGMTILAPGETLVLSVRFTVAAVTGRL